MQDPNAYFSSRRDSFASEAAGWQKKSNVISTLRFALFLLFLALVAYFANDRNFRALVALVAVFPFGFGLLVKYHNRIRQRLALLRNLEHINTEELNRLAFRLGDLDQGADFADEQHPYTSDLGIFGKHSLFQLLNRCATPAGRRLLASWLQAPATRTEILARQAAVQELRQQAAWTQQLRASGMRHHREPDQLPLLRQWLNEPFVFLQKKPFAVAALLLPLVFITALAGYLAGAWPFLFVLGSMAVNGLFLLVTSKDIGWLADQTARNAQALKSYQAMLKLVEEKEPADPRLQEIKNKIVTSGRPASARIASLAAITENLEMRRNAYFYAVANPTLLWDIFWVWRLERWKSLHRAALPGWFDALAELEALCSIAGFWQANPGFNLPVISEKDFVYRASGLAHLLIPPAKSIRNDFLLENTGRVAIVTGSNMSGKSTFMRTAGINAVLAFAGAPVNAHALELSEFRIFSAMHIHDSLEESTSSFYAELKRIRQLLGLVKEGGPVFYLLDEILKGTNTTDRHKGAKALIKQLLKTSSSGMISTHDLELGRLEQELGGRLINYSFNSRIEEDRIIFDYRLQRGICHSFNASKLMEQMGIEMGEGE